MAVPLTKQVAGFAQETFRVVRVKEAARRAGLASPASYHPFGNCQAMETPVR